MSDLYIGIIIVAAVSALLLAVGLRVGKRVKPRAGMLLTMIGILVLLAYERFASDRLWMARLLPFSNLVIVGDFYPPLVALTAGLAWSRMPGGVFRRSIFLIPLTLLPWVWIAMLVWGSPPPMGNRWRDGVCRQTSNASCSAAAAATLMWAHYIVATEGEMADLCLTRQQGTTMHGLYRGLTLMGTVRSLKPVPFFSDIETLRRTLDKPVILSVQLLPGDPHELEYAKWHWQAGSGHTVVLIQFLPGDLVEIGDPETGREKWTLEQLRVLWHGEGIRMDKTTKQNTPGPEEKTRERM